MTTDQSTLSLGRGETWEGYEKKPPFLVRIPANLFKFARRKPLGAFGGFLVLILIGMALTGGGLSALVHKDLPTFRELPLINKVTALQYKYNDYTLGKHILESPSSSHWLGTDDRGRDLLSRILYGAGVSMSIGIGVLLISTTLSTTLTLVSGYYVTSVDLFLQRVIEIFHIVPPLILLVSLMAIYGATPVTLVLTLGILGGFSTSRVLRSLVIGLRGMPYIEATKSLGAGDGRILLRHILPNVFYLIIVSATAAVSGAIATEAGLAIIGVGLDPLFPTWGTLLDGSRSFVRIAPWLTLAPALMLAMTIFGFRLLGDALRDVLDPRLRGSR